MQPFTQTCDGTVTDGRKGIAYLRDHFVPALLAECADTAASNGAAETRSEYVPAPT
ncbi:MAG TPA: hypothetical protein VF855_14930 [Acidimicrobiales bacterium]